jgi:hypothetical protein
LSAVPTLFSEARMKKQRVMRWSWLFLVAVGLVAVAIFHTRASAWGRPQSFLDQLADHPAVSVTTIPSTGLEAGDVNPYGVAVVPFDAGALHRGDILVSNFNDAAGDQGTGSTIVRIDPKNSSQKVFFDAKSPIGLTTALYALQSGFVVVGSAQRTDDTPPMVTNGMLIFLDAGGKQVFALTDSAFLNGPWDMTASEIDPDRPKLFVSSVLSGDVVRIDLKIHKKSPFIEFESITKIGSGFATRTDPAALVIGPTGLAFDADADALFVADTGGNRIARLDHVSDTRHDQGSGSTVFSGPPLFGPLGLVLVPGSKHLVAVNGDAVMSDTPNMAVEISQHGDLIAQKTLDDSGTSGALFGIALTTFEHELSLVWVDDNNNNVNVSKTR